MFFGRVLLLFISLFSIDAFGIEVLNLRYKHIPNEVIVKFQEQRSVNIKTVLAKFNAQIDRTFKSSGAVLIKFPMYQINKFRDSREALSRLVTKIDQIAPIEYAEANTIVYANVIPNDEKFSELYGLYNTTNPGADINATKAWDITIGSKSVLVAVIDTGIDYNHPDIADNYWYNSGEIGFDANGNDKKTNGIDDDNNGFVDDYKGWDFANNDNDPFDDYGHGTHCAGTIGAVGNNGIGVVGVNWNVSLVALKFLSANGSGTTADAISSIEYATSIGANLSSNSWGGGGYSPTMYAAISEAMKNNILFIAAAGNDSVNNDSVDHYPSSYNLANVIAVAATDSQDNLAYFSNYGFNSVHLGAPGVQILSTIPGGDYAKYSGTSMATPHVSGAAALILSKYPNLNFIQVKHRLLYGVDKIQALINKTITSGRLNIFNSLEEDNISPSPIKNISIVEKHKIFIRVSWSTTGDDGDYGKASAYVLRYSDKAILNEEDWNNARTPEYIIEEVWEDGMKAYIYGLPINYKGYLAIRAYDNVGNISDIRGIYFEVLPVNLFYSNTADSLNDIEVSGKWNIEFDSDIQSNVFSDSVGGDYDNNSEATMIFGPFNIDSPDLLLSFDTKYVLESSYDFGYVEISTDNGVTWEQIDKYTGVSSWTLKIYDLSEYIKEANTFKIRFKMTSDYMVVKDGWYIDNVSLLK